MKNPKTTVGELRARAAYCNSDSQIEIMTTDESIKDFISNLEVVCCYPDTKNSSGEWISTFKIQIRKKV